MRITFPRLPDDEKAYAVIERDDGVVYRLYGGVAGSSLPHDIRHLIVERRLGIGDGLWGPIAAGAVFRAAGLRAEMIENLVEQVAALDAPSEAEIRRLARNALSVLPPGDSDVSATAVAAAARALQVEAARWARLRPGQELVYDWPSIPRQRVPR